MQELAWLLLPVAAAFGWLSARYSKDKAGSSSGSILGPDYIKGLNYLLNEQQDKAIDVFIRMLEVNSDTVETHLALGNLFRKPLREICAAYEPGAHPVTAPILEGGPAALARRYDLPHAEAYADACHLCYALRVSLRPRFPDILTPDGMYGLFDESPPQSRLTASK